LGAPSLAAIAMLERRLVELDAKPRGAKDGWAIEWSDPNGLGWRFEFPTVSV
jgi:hypothetical protein